MKEVERGLGIRRADPSMEHLSALLAFRSGKITAKQYQEVLRSARAQEEKRKQELRRLFEDIKDKLSGDDSTAYAV
ncbi:MAG TPA: hypothetical protein DGR79_00520 [Clostridiales bacterium]|nr:hypothetical protein [Clostridiales bacterium]